MKSLHTAQAIRSRIRDVLAASGNNRHALVAFIGPDPLKWLARPKGLNIYCWPLAGATNPIGIDRLRAAGANVSFVEGLHAKVYHSDRGTVIGSANLSVNALQGKLLETAVWLPPGLFCWSDQMAQVRKKTVYEAETRAFDERLEQLRREHVAFSQRNPRRGNRHALNAADIVEADNTQVPSFADWLATPGRAAWQLGGWWAFEDEPTDTLKAFEEETGAKAKQYLGTASRSVFELHVATLAFRYTPTNGSARKSLRWWFPEMMRKSSNPRWANNPFIWLASQEIPDGCVAPFDEKELRFQTALDKTVRKLGEKVERMRGPVSKRFLDTLADFY